MKKQKLERAAAEAEAARGGDGGDEEEMIPVRKTDRLGDRKGGGGERGRAGEKGLYSNNSA